MIGAASDLIEHSSGTVPQVLNARFDNSQSTVALSSKRNSQRCTMLSWHTLVAFVHSQAKVDKNEQRTRICFSGLWIVSILSPSLNSIQEYQHVSSFHQMWFKDRFQFISPCLSGLQTGTKKIWRARSNMYKMKHAQFPLNPGPVKGAQPQVINSGNV